MQSPSASWRTGPDRSWHVAGYRSPYETLYWKPRDRVLPPYSALNAVIGSIRAARRAGRYAAMPATTSSKTVACE